MEAAEPAELDGDGPGQVVDAEVELGEVREAAELPRDVPAEVVVVEVEAGEAREHGERGRDGAGEPLPLQRDGGDPAARVAGDSLEVVPAAAWVAAAHPRASARPEGSSAALSSMSASTSALRGDDASAAAAAERSRSRRWMSSRGSERLPPGRHGRERGSGDCHCRSGTGESEFLGACRRVGGGVGIGRFIGGSR